MNEEVEQLSRELQDALDDREELKMILHQNGLLRDQQREQSRGEGGGGGEDFHLALKLNMKMEEVAGREEEFMDEVCEDVADAVGGRKEKVKVRGMREGSILLDIVLLEGICEGGKSARMAAEALRAQAADESSRLRGGKHTSKTSSLDIIRHTEEIVEGKRSVREEEEDRRMREIAEEERKMREILEEERRRKVKEEERLREEEERRRRQQDQAALRALAAGLKQDEKRAELSELQMEDLISSRTSELVRMHQLEADLELLRSSTEDDRMLEMSDRIAELMEKHETSIKELARLASMAEEHKRGQHEAEEQLLRYKDQVYLERKRMMKASVSSFNEHEVLQRRLEAKSEECSALQAQCTLLLSHASSRSSQQAELTANMEELDRTLRQLEALVERVQEESLQKMLASKRVQQEQARELERLRRMEDLRVRELDMLREEISQSSTAGSVPGGQQGMKKLLELTVELEEVTARLVEEEMRVQQLEEQTEDYETMMLRVQDKVNELERSHDEFAEVNEHLQLENSRLETQLGQELEELRRRSELLQLDNSRLQQALESQGRRLRDSEEQRHQLLGELQDVKEDLHALRELELEAQLHSIILRIEEAERQEELLEEELLGMHVRVRELHISNSEQREVQEGKKNVKEAGEGGRGGKKDVNMASNPKLHGEDSSDFSESSGPERMRAMITRLAMAQSDVSEEEDQGEEEEGKKSGSRKRTTDRKRRKRKGSLVTVEIFRSQGRMARFISLIH